LEAEGAIWYVACGGQQQGPFDVETVIGMIRGGQVDGSASVSAPYLNGWTPISQEPTFAPHLPAASQPPAPAPYTGPTPAPYTGPTPAPYTGPAPAPYTGPAPAAPTPKAFGGPVVSSGKGLRIAGWILLGTAAFFLLVIPLMALDEDAKSGNWSGGVMVVIMFGLPGGLLMWRGRKAAAKAQLVGFLTSRDRIKVTEVARMIEKSELATDQLLAQLNQELRLDLIYVPDERQYMHRSRLSATHQIPDKCATCGAPTQNQLVLKGERITCKYCDAIVA